MLYTWRTITYKDVILFSTVNNFETLFFITGITASAAVEEIWGLDCGKREFVATAIRQLWQLPYGSCGNCHTAVVATAIRQLWQLPYGSCRNCHTAVVATAVRQLWQLPYNSLVE